MFSLRDIHFQGVKGIDELHLTLSEQPINVMIGTNGIGKTKALEALYTLILFTHSAFQEYYISKSSVVFSDCFISNQKMVSLSSSRSTDWTNIKDVVRDNKFIHNYPVVFLAAQNRGKIVNSSHGAITPLGSAEERREKYFQHIIESMKNDFSSLNMDTPIEEWIIQRANSSTSYQDDADNREIELISLLKILHKIDNRISDEKSSLKISGNNTVSILVEGKKTELSALSSGFSSLIKIIQSIVAGYAFFTNSQELESVEGYVLIDEIESHLHLEWQTKILPILAEVFPKTRFIITTHSSLVLSQLYHGTASRLIRKNERIVNEEISNASNFALIDLIQEAFNIDLNKIKINATNAKYQEDAKKAILTLLGG